MLHETTFTESSKRLSFYIVLISIYRWKFSNIKKLFVIRNNENNGMGTQIQTSPIYFPSYQILKW